MLLKLIDTEVELAAAFLETGATTRCQTRRSAALNKVKCAIESVRKFAKRVEDNGTRAKISEQIDNLQRGLEMTF